MKFKETGFKFTELQTQKYNHASFSAMGSSVKSKEFPNLQEETL